MRERTGLELDATFPATKLRWVLDQVGGEDLAYGDVASWLLRRLGGVHVCDAGNAARSLLCPLGGTDWDDELLELFGIPRALLPPIVDSDAHRGDDRRRAGARRGRRPAGVAVRAALLGARDREGHARHRRVRARPGGRGAAGAARRHPRLLRLAARGRDELRARGLHPDRRRGARLVRAHRRAPGRAAELDALLRESAPGTVACVPALQGLGSPTWDAGARGALLGLSLGTTRADLARAVVDGVLHQVADALDALGALEELWVDGGLSRSDWIVQRLADLSGVPVLRTARADSTALGAATLAGLAAGVWARPEALPEIPLDLSAEPRWPASERAAERERWAAARATVATGNP